LIPDSDAGGLSSLTVFFPAYNDALSIPGLVRKTFDLVSPLTPDFAVVVVNDGSSDQTGAVLDQLRKELGPRLEVITHPQNRGYGAALLSGFAAAEKEFVFYTDGDAQYDVGELTRLIERMEPGVGLVNGYKVSRSDPRHRIWIGSLYNRFARWMFRVGIRDIDCDFRLIRRSVLDNIRLDSTSGTICLELVKRIQMSGCGIREAPVNHYPRQHGRSQFFRWAPLWATFREFVLLYIRLVVLRRRGNRTVA
jgi:glycosyltransferase involved in cell wall biosynthesis